MAGLSISVCMGGLSKTRIKNNLFHLCAKGLDCVLDKESEINKAALEPTYWLSLASRLVNNLCVHVFSYNGNFASRI